MKKADANYKRKHLCRECRYRTPMGNLLSQTEYYKALEAHGVKRNPHEHMYACGYCYITDTPCLSKDGKDKQGTNPAKCKLFEKGNPPDTSRRETKLPKIPMSERYTSDPHFIM